MQLAPSLCANSEYSEWLRKIDVSQRLLKKAATTGEVQVGTDLRGLRVAAGSVLGLYYRSLNKWVFPYGGCGVRRRWWRRLAEDEANRSERQERRSG